METWNKSPVNYSEELRYWWEIFTNRHLPEDQRISNMHILCTGFPFVYFSFNRRRKFARMDSDSEVDDRFAAAAGESEEGSEEEEEDEIETPKKRKMDSRKRLDSETQEKKKKPGVIYLSSVPDGMNVTQTTAFFSEFGRFTLLILLRNNVSVVKDVMWILKV